MAGRMLGLTEAYLEEDFKYRDVYGSDKDITITGLSDSLDKTKVVTIRIPSTINGKNVYGVGTWVAFLLFPSLKTVILPASLEEIHGQVCFGSKSLTEYKIPEENTRFTAVDGVLFSKDMKTLVAYPMCKPYSTYNVPEGVTKIGGFAFGGCNSLTSVILPQSLENIGQWAFSCCTGIKSLTVPASVTTVENDSFRNWTNGQTITVTWAKGNKPSYSYSTGGWEDN